MRLSRIASAVGTMVLCGAGFCVAAENSPASLAALHAKAKARTAAVSRVTLAEESADSLKDLDAGELIEDGKVPNYLKALAVYPGGPAAFAHLMKSVVSTGDLGPELKLAMALRIAQAYGAPYLAAHAEYLLKGSERGQNLLAAVQSGKFEKAATRDDLALKYADLLTHDIHGVSDEDFRKVRGYFNDGEVVELTLTVCFFNYFTRFTEALNLPVESWVMDGKIGAKLTAQELSLARVALISDAEMQATQQMDANLKDPKNPINSWRIGFANSMRAMLRRPEIAQAWMKYGTTVRQSAAIDRNLQLQVSFAVSMANGCRYCTLHQVLGLHRLGVSVAKLMEMKKDDDALTPKEKAAVVFARKLTAEPASITDADYGTLKTEFGDKGAEDVVLQTAAFSFMNRFTDGLRLPSEDEAIRTYQEVYGTSWTAPEKKTSK